MTVDVGGTCTVVGSTGAAVPPGPLAGDRVVGGAADTADRVLVRHLVDLGATRRSADGPLRLVRADGGETLVRFDLTEKDGLTTVRLTHSGLTPEALQAHKGWPQVLGWLRDYAEP